VHGKTESQNFKGQRKAAMVNLSGEMSSFASRSCKINVCSKVINEKK
jgi:hypothetical protein